jgi:hypothetical protein
LIRKVGFYATLEVFAEFSFEAFLTYPFRFSFTETRAMRRKLTKSEASIKTLRQQKKEAYFPLRKFALKA